MFNVMGDESFPNRCLSDCACDTYDKGLIEDRIKFVLVQDVHILWKGDFVLGFLLPERQDKKIRK